MNDQPFFALSSYHVGMALIGAGIIAAFWLPRFVSGREPAASALLILGGLIFALAIDEPPLLFNPIANPQRWEVMSELAVIVALFATGMRLDVVRPFGRWRAAWRCGRPCPRQAPGNTTGPARARPRSRPRRRGSCRRVEGNRWHTGAAAPRRRARLRSARFRRVQLPRARRRA